MKLQELCAYVLVSLLAAALAWSSAVTAVEDGASDLLDSNSFSTVVRRVGRALTDDFDRILNFPSLEEVYDNETARVEFLELNGSEIIEDLADQLAAYFQTIEDVLKNSTAFTEELYIQNLNTGCCSQECTTEPGSNFNLSACCHEGNCGQICRHENDTDEIIFVEPQLDFYRAMVEEQGISIGGDFAQLDLRANPEFDRLVDLNNTALHYPLDIFDRDPRVLCFSQWSDNLTAHYQLQFNEYHLTLYFASSTGILRIYPASDWSLLNQCYRCPLDQVDTYDSRHRPWYVNTVPGSKFLVLIMDTSGSMIGFRLLLAKIIAQQLLLSLSQNDFFLVLEVNGDPPAPLMGCFDNKTRATPENILTMNEIIESLTEVRGRVSTFREVLQLAAWSLASEPECHGIIAVLSDQDSLNSDLAAKIREIRSVVDARAFVFLTGFRRDTVFDNRSAIIEASILTGGKLFQVQEYSDIMANIREFTDCLRPLTPLSNSREEVFYNHYKDVFGGLTLTASQPLYVRNDDEDSCNGSFVGVSGVDVDLEGVRASLFRQDIGPFGYWFVVDNNGQLLVHPLINYDYIRNLSGDDLIALDVSNFEHARNSSDFEEVRRSMLDREVGSRTLEAWVPIAGGEEFQLMSVTYYYAPVTGTPFSAAIVLPVNSSVRNPALVNTTSLLSKFREERDWVTHHIAEGRYPCSTLSPLPPTLGAEDFLEELIEAVESLPNHSIADCIQEQYEQLLNDLSLSYSLLDQVEISSDDELLFTSNRRLRVILQFPSGLTVCAPFFDAKEEIVSRKFQCPEEVLSQSYLQDTILQYQATGGSEGTVYYHSATDSMLVSVRVLERNGDTPGLASEPSLITSGGVLGLVSSRLDLDKILSDSISEALSSSADTTSSFYLLEGGGMVVASRDGIEFTGPFGYLYPDIFREMLDMGVYQSTTVLGSEVRPCADLFLPTTGCSDSSSLSISKGVVLSLMSAVKWIIGGGLWTVVKLGFMSLQASLHHLVLAEEVITDDCLVSLCQRKTVFYQLNQSVLVSGSCMINGSHYGSGFQAASVPGTNLLLVEVGSNCQQSNTNMTSQEDDLVMVICPCECGVATPVLNETCTGYRRELNDTCYSNSTAANCCSVTGGASPDHLHISLILSLPFLLYIMLP